MAAAVAVSANYFCYRYVKVSGTQKMGSMGKTYCNATIPSKYMYALNIMCRPNRVNSRHLKGK